MHGEGNISIQFTVDLICSHASWNQKYNGN